MAAYRVKQCVAVQCAEDCAADRSTYMWRLLSGAEGAPQSPSAEPRGTSAAVASGAQAAQSSESDRPQPPALAVASSDAGHLSMAPSAADVRRNGILAPTDGCPDMPTAVGSGTKQPEPVPAPRRGRLERDQTATVGPAAAVLEEVRGMRASVI